LSRSARVLPAPVFDNIPQFAARANVSVRTIHRLIDQGLPVVRMRRSVRIDPVIGMAYLRGEHVPKPPPPRRLDRARPPRKRQRSEQMSARGPDGQPEENRRL
jgi:hypothetical protein